MGFFFFFLFDEVESMDGIILVGADCGSEKDTGYHVENLNLMTIEKYKREEIERKIMEARVFT
jgi:hypothetical protein